MADPKRLDVLLGELYGGASLHGALVAAFPGKVLGVSTYGPARPATIWLAGDVSDEEIEAVTLAAKGHLPVAPVPGVDPAVEIVRLRAELETLKRDVSDLKGGKAALNG